MLMTLRSLDLYQLPTYTLVRYPLQPLEDKPASDRLLQINDDVAISVKPVVLSQPRCPVGLRVNNEVTYQQSRKKLLPP